MAVTDIYELRWRTEQGAVVMNNSMTYDQVTNLTAPYTDGASALIGCIRDVALNILTWWRFVASTEARITCAIAQKIEDNSGTGPEKSFLYDVGFTGALSDPMAPSQCLAFTMFPIMSPDSNARAKRNLMIGGLSETILDGNGVSQTVGENLRTNAAYLLAPQANENAEQYFQAVVNRATETNPTSDYRPVVRLNPPLFASRQTSRRLRLCV